MKQSDIVHHVGEVVSVKGNRVKVLVKSASACSACHAKGACSSADFQEKYIETKTDAESSYALGDKVWVSCSDSQGLYALLWAYIVPLVLVLVLLFVGYALWADELKAGLLSLVCLPFYYLFLYVQRTFFDKKLLIKIKKASL